MRDAFIGRLARRASEDSSITLVVGDLGFGVVTEFAEAFPLQFLNAGVAEQSMIGVAAGMAAAGRKVFVYSIANFPTMRCLEQIRNDVCYHGLDVTIVSVGAGLAYGSLGYSHHAVEDIAVMRAFPGLTIYSPCDPLEAAAAVDAICLTSGPSYLRLGKNREPILHATEPDLASGEPLLLRDGVDLTLFTVGAVAVVGLQVADTLEREHGMSVRVMSVPRIKPLNTADLVTAAAGTRAIATLEEHSIVGGFGSAVLESFAAARVRTPVLPLGLRDEAQSAVGSQAYLRDLGGLSAGAITDRLLGYL
jgi:transketolase